ncbi:hypothetical protein [Nocardioides ungokensis]|uniref:hypothetical protein n=1 Tax=Nocardioides ungokensis TaxID=1643322 RepID=UPI0015DF5F99|nr:hypothetical protein [Nocardioides ungokensis]
MTTRLVIGGAGVLLGLYGAWLLLSRHASASIVDAGVWLVAGVVLHDLVLAPLFLVLTLVATRVLPPAARAPVTVGAVVLGSTTLLAVPVLGRFGAKADNPTLLDRDYTAGWLLFAGLVLAGVVLATVVRARRGGGSPTGRGAHGPGARR